MGSRGFLWFSFMRDEIYESTVLHTFYGIDFDRKIPASNILYNILWAPTDERRARINIPAEKKSWWQQGLNPLTSR
jgi:hypothetical protein